MKEKIGNVVLDYEFYPGKDLYSDGAVEEELLEIASNHKGEEFNRIIAEKKSWPVLYHFSHVRNNITDWLPISKKDKVLEIGSGCGAVTGSLAKKAGRVTCIDLSKMRSRINAYRHQELKNIEIMVGNFQDIEKTLPSDYDYITLIGVFEYSEGYIGTDNPYVDMLRIISGHLKPGGKLVIAIENRFGLKYWAGCTEDHVGTYFEGIEGYPNTNGVRTFTRKELEEIFREADLDTFTFYYPYPDYKFPMYVYSDMWLPKVGELREINYNFDRQRVRLFDETRTNNSILENGLFHLYANSFLVLLEKQQEQEEEFARIFVKYSNERSPFFSIRTEILKKSNGEKKVCKFPETQEGKTHLEHIAYTYEKLSDIYAGTPIELNRCVSTGEGIELEYLTGITLETVLDGFLRKKKFEKLWQTLKRYLDVLDSVGNDRDFVMTDGFKEVFGDVSLPTGLKCARMTNIDPVCNNIVWEEDRWQMLDYEWSFEFPVPVHYQIFRVLKYYLYTSTARGRLLELDFFTRAGICREEIEAYEIMESNFQRYILGNKVPIRDMYQDISPGVLFDLRDRSALQSLEYKDKVQIYEDYGDDFSEEDSRFLTREDGSFKAEILVSPDVRRIRIDPCCSSCILEDVKIKARTEKEGCIPLPYAANGINSSDKRLIFNTEDPYLVTDYLPKETISVLVEFRVAECGKEVLELLLKEKKQKEELASEVGVLKETLAGREALIQEMKNTKVWRAYQMMKKGFKNE